MSPRKRQDKTLPPYTYRGKSAFEFKPYKGKGVARPTIRLCGLNQPMSRVWEAWEEAQESAKSDTLEWLLREYAASHSFRHRGDEPKSPRTIAEQERMLEHIVKRPRGRGKRFGGAKLKDITPGVITRYLDARLADGAGVAGNRERALISKAWNWAYARDLTRAKNPCDRIRKVEALTARKSQVLEEGFDTLRRKGSKDAITQWSDRLRAAAIDVPHAFTPGRFSEYIVTNTRGLRITISAYNSARARWMKKAKAAGAVQEHFTVHDLKRKGATDAEQDATVTTGNSPAMSKVYDVSKLIARATR